MQFEEINFTFDAEYASILANARHRQLKQIEEYSEAANKYLDKVAEMETEIHRLIALNKIFECDFGQLQSKYNRLKVDYDALHASIEQIATQRKRRRTDSSFCTIVEEIDANDAAAFIADTISTSSAIEGVHQEAFLTTNSISRASRSPSTANGMQNNIENITNLLDWSMNNDSLPRSASFEQTKNDGSHLDSVSSSISEHLTRASDGVPSSNHNDPHAMSFFYRLNFSLTEDGNRVTQVTSLILSAWISERYLAQRVIGSIARNES